MILQYSVSKFPKYLSLPLILFFILFFPWMGNAQQDLKPTVTPQQIDAVFKDWDDPQKPGIAVGVISNGKVVFKKGYGSANLEHQIPITTSTNFHTGAWSRMFTTFAILLLEEKGKLSLQDEVRKYIPEVPQMSEKVTLHHLLSHTSGLDDYAALKALSGWKETDIFTKKQAYHFLKKQKKLNHSPGEKYSVNSTGFMLLEDVVTKVSGKPFASFCKENIFAPLNMTNTFYAQSAGEIIANRAKGYAPEGDGFRNVTLPFSEVGPSQLYTTIDDILNWMMNFRNPKVGNANILKKMDTPASLHGKSVELNNQALYLGQHRFWNFKGTNKMYIIGGGNGYSCKIIRFPDQDLMAVVLGNAGRYNGYMTSHVADLYLDKYYKTPETVAAEKATPKKLSVEKLQNLTGTFWNSESFFRTTLEVKDEQMQYREMEHNWGTPLATLDDNTFELVEGSGTVTVKKEQGKKSLVLALSNGTQLTSLAYDPNAAWTNNLTAFTGTYFSEKLGATYVFKIEDGNLVGTHARLNDFTFTPLHNNAFTSTNENFKEIIFERNSQNGIKGFRLNNRKVKDILFEKVSGKMEN